MNFPLGEPVNRPAPPPELRPIEGRPNWWIDSKGVEKYIEPPKKPQPWHPIALQSDEHVAEIVACAQTLRLLDTEFPVEFWGTW